jgi:hypothetical protein
MAPAAAGGSHVYRFLLSLNMRTFSASNLNQVNGPTPHALPLMPEGDLSSLRPLSSTRAARTHSRWLALQERAQADCALDWANGTVACAAGAMDFAVRLAARQGMGQVRECR